MILNEQVAQMTLILHLYIVYQNVAITVFQQINLLVMDFFFKF